ncbi:MAG: type II CAAX endopeptidase family protein [Armatimonadota bacterium]
MEKYLSSNENKAPKKSHIITAAVIVVFLILQFSFLLSKEKEQTEGTIQSTFLFDYLLIYSNKSKDKMLSQDFAYMIASFIDKQQPSLELQRRSIALKIVYGFSIEKDDIDKLIKYKENNPDSYKKYPKEIKMWKSIAKSKKLSIENADKYIKNINYLDIGPIKGLLKAHIYEMSGRKDISDSIRQKSVSLYKLRYLLFMVLIILMVVCSIGGLFFIYIFIANHYKTISAMSLFNGNFKSLILAFVCYLVFSNFFALILTLALPDSPEYHSRYLSAIIASNILAVIFAFIMMRFNDILARTKSYIGMISFSVKDIKFAIGAFCASLPMVLGTFRLITKLFPSMPMTDNPIFSMLSGDSLTIILSFIFAVLIAPILEEIVFRGFLFSGLRIKLRFWHSAAISGMIFSLIHPTYPSSFLALTLLGIILALIREHTKSLYPTMICHFLYNLFIVSFALLISI